MKCSNDPNQSRRFDIRRNSRAIGIEKPSILLKKKGGQGLYGK